MKFRTARSVIVEEWVKWLEQTIGVEGIFWTEGFEPGYYFVYIHNNEDATAFKLRFNIYERNLLY